MNAERLLELADHIIKADQRHTIQDMLNQLASELQNVSSQPQNTSFQTQYSDTLKKFNNHWASFEADFSAAELRMIQDIGADKYFTIDFPNEISRVTADNQLTPMVVYQFIYDFSQRRAEFLTHLSELRTRLQLFGFNTPVLSAGEAEVGFLLPRDLFDNHLDRLISELRVINRVIRAFSELATGSVEPIEVHQISTSDPLFFFGLDPRTVSLVGRISTWAIDTWKKVEEIRKLRAETKKSKIFTEDKIKAFFDDEIEQTLKSAIDEKVKDLLPSKETGRTQEQKNDLAWALESVLSRVERGMTVEIRFIPPTKTDDPGVDQQQQAPFQEMREVVSELHFPPAETSPILKLPPIEPPSTPKPASKASSQQDKK